VTASETVFQGRKFEVQRRAVEIAGTAHVFDIVTHPGAAVILPVLDDHRIVLIHNYREAVRTELLEVPAGTIDPGESAQTCAGRELTEETGYTAGSVTPLVDCYSSPGILNERMYGFLATDLTPGPTAHESGEQIRVTTTTLDEALEGIRTGRILDGKTILMLLYYERFIRDGEAQA
jgi:ADP-ribose pyrophosphatase